jgi:acyl dehydratase
MLYLEDFTPGQEITLGSRSVTKEEIIAFATQFDPQPFHIDEDAAAKTIYGGLIASGWHTVSLFMRLLADGLLADAASMGSPGVDEVRWLKPVRPNDVLSAKGVVEEVRPSRSKPDRGMLRTTYVMYNQDGEMVLSMKGLGMFGRRPKSDARAPQGV